MYPSCYSVCDFRLWSQLMYPGTPIPGGRVVAGIDWQGNNRFVQHYPLHAWVAIPATLAAVCAALHCLHSNIMTAHPNMRAVLHNPLQT